MEPGQYSQPSGVAFAFSGAGGRIAQQAALSQALIFGEYPAGIPIIPSFLAGVSSGALSAVALNGALEYTATNGAAGWSYEEWNNFIFGLDDNAVFKGGLSGAFSTLKNLDDGEILDNSPLVDSLNNALKRIGYNRFGDLYLPTYITVVDQRSGANVRLLSTDPEVADIPLIQILMATTAIPVAFPPRYITALTNNTVFVDGGTGIDYVPVIPLLSGTLPVTTVYAITPNVDIHTGSNSADEPPLEKIAIIRNALRAYEIQGRNLSSASLMVLANSGRIGYHYAARLDQTFSTLNFKDEQLQYNLVKDWASRNNPTSVNAMEIINFNERLIEYYGNGYKPSTTSLSLKLESVESSATNFMAKVTPFFHK